MNIDGDNKDGKSAPKSTSFNLGGDKQSSDGKIIFFFLVLVWVFPPPLIFFTIYLEKFQKIGPPNLGNA